MRHPLLTFGLVSAASAVAFEVINFPLDAMIGPIFVIGILAYITGESPGPGVDATDFAIMLIGRVLGSQVTPEILNHGEKWPASILLLLLKWQVAIDGLKQGLLILSKTIAPAICLNILGVTLTAISAYITHVTIDLPLSDNLLGFMPGGF